MVQEQVSNWKVHQSEKGIQTTQEKGSGRVGFEWKNDIEQFDF